MKQRLLGLFIVLHVLALWTAAPSGLVAGPTVYAQAGVAAACGGTFPAVADTAVSRNAPDTAYGDDRTLRIANGRGIEWRSLLSFQIAGRLPRGVTIRSARLVLSLSGTPRPLPYAIAVRSLNGRWSESVTWNTQPAPQGRYGDQASLGSSGVLSLDLTTLVTQWVTPAAIFSSSAIPILHPT